MDEARDDRYEAWEDDGADADGGWHDSAPPTSGAVVRAPTTWPISFGVISIVLGAMGVLGGVIGAAVILLLPRLMPQGQATLPTISPQVMTYTIASSAVGTLVAVLLIIAGVGLVRRRRWGVGAIRTWAIIKIVLAVVASGISLWLQSTMQTTPANGAASNSALPAVAHVTQIISLVLGLAWAMAWPIVCLVWLSRASVRAEHEQWT